MSEHSLTALIVRALREKGAWVLKVHGGGWSRRGIPDLLVCHRGRFVALEVKAGSRSATPLQTHELRQIGAAGGKGAVVRSVTEAIAIVDLEAGGAAGG